MALPTWYQDIFSRYKTLLQTQSHLYIALSAGVDSNMLLHWLYTFKSQLPPITSIHVNHNWHGEYSHIWAKFAQDRSTFYGFTHVHYDIYFADNDPRSLEAAGREERYLKFGETMVDNSLLCVAHHRSDQAETVFHRLIRSAGTRGMGAMRDLTTLQFGPHTIALFRPFLSISKSELYRTAKALDIPWMEDYTNHEIDEMTRNIIRNDIFPKIEQYFPYYEHAFYQTSQFMQESYDLLVEVAQEDIAHLSPVQNKLQRSQLLTYSLARQKNVLQYWFSLYQLTLSQEQFAEFYRSFIENEPTHQSRFQLQEMTLYFYQDYFYLIAENPEKTNNSLPVLQWESAHFAPPKSFWEQKKLALKPRANGIRFHPLQRDKSQTLKKLLQEYNLPVWQRQNIWMICDANTDEIYWISHIGLAKSLEKFCVEEGVIPHLN